MVIIVPAINKCIYLYCILFTPNITYVCMNVQSVSN